MYELLEHADFVSQKLKCWTLQTVVVVDPFERVFGFLLKTGPDLHICCADIEV